ncbi:MAG: hypothetical protein Greene041679_512, partial [Parcubacteria group bacterium Greene0416_79]
MLNSMRKYLRRTPEMDKLLVKLISPYIKGEKLNILDAGCGIGQLAAMVHRLSPASEIL